ncbi:hypothetical protein AVEN_151022-1 [Araneus ventricosus]|uniref:Uncharacterized protein n=1 Tax=Araneus ventricosus TaxID=182803 RepID=A0A4Y2IAM9_ARAVE|nr:hypothetical protein AVEN_151022-1 [Araneus ventricosus]
MGAEIKAPPGTCSYYFHIHGQIYHMVSPLCSNERNRPGSGQLYIFDSSEENSRYVSAPEVMWRLNEFSLSEKSHAIMRLAAHLRNQQQVVKKSAVIMLLQNLMPSKGLCKGLYNKAKSDKTTA